MSFEYSPTYIFGAPFEAPTPLAQEAQELYSVALRHPGYSGRVLSDDQLRRLHGHIATRLNVGVEDIPALLVTKLQSDPL